MYKEVNLVFCDNCMHIRIKALGEKLSGLQTWYTDLPTRLQVLREDKENRGISVVHHSITEKIKG